MAALSNRTNRASVFLFLGPSLIVLAVFFFIPVIAAFLMSFSDFDIYSLGNVEYIRFVLFQNYTKLFNDPLFWK